MKRRYGLIPHAILFAALATCSLAACGGSFGQDDLNQSIDCSHAETAAGAVDGASVELLVPAWSNMPSSRRARYHDLARGVIALTCEVPRTSLEIRPITANSFEAARVFRGTVPSSDDAPAWNPKVLAAKQDAYVSGALAALDGLQAYPPAKRSDVMGAVKTAADAISARPGRRLLAIVHHGWPESPDDLYIYRDDPRRHLDSYVAHLRASAAMPNLKGITVVLLGVASGPTDMESSSQTLEQLCGFWRDFVAVAGGTLPANGCQAGLPDDLIRQELLGRQ